MKVYLASSWENILYETTLEYLRKKGYDVHDFRDRDKGFNWNDIDLNWMDWSIGEYREGLDHYKAGVGYKFDLDAMEAADACVIVWPCGISSHMEAAWLAAKGKPVIAFGIPKKPDLMHKMFSAIVSNIIAIHPLIERYLEKNHEANTPHKKTFALSAALETFSIGFYAQGSLPGYIGFCVAIVGFLVLLAGNLMDGV